MTVEEHAENIRTTLAAVEQTHRAHGRAITTHHKALAALVNEHGASLGAGGDVIVAAAAPKNPPPNPE